MARKKIGGDRPQPKKAELVPATAYGAKWINTPFAYTSLMKNMTLLQQSVLLRVSEQLQTFISKYYNDKRNEDKINPDSLFRLDVETPTVHLTMSDFGLAEYRNREISAAADELKTLWMKMPNILEDGTVDGYKLFPVFEELTIPRFADGDVAPDKSVITAKIGKRAAEIAFNMAEKYVNHPLQIADNAGQVYSPLLYFLLKHEWVLKPRKTIIYPYKKLREDLGMKEEARDSEGRRTGDYTGKEFYPQFSRFCTFVLDRCKKDLDGLAKKNLIDLTFEYEPVYRGFSKRGDPESIKFEIVLSELSNPKKRRAKAIAEADKSFKEQQKAKAKKAEEMSPGLFDDIEDSVTRPVETIENRVQRAKNLVDSIDVNWNIELGRFADYRYDVIYSACSLHPETAKLIIMVLNDLKQCYATNGIPNKSIEIIRQMKTDPRLKPSDLTKKQLKEILKQLD